MRHALSDVIVSWQRSEHGYTSLCYEKWSVSCIASWQRSKYDDIPSSKSHAMSVAIVPWQRSEHGCSPQRYEICSVSCHRLMTTVRAWLFISKVWNMLPQLSSSHHNGQSIDLYPLVWNMLRQLSSSHKNGHSMAIYNSYRKHAPSVVTASWQRSEYDYTLSRMS